jgi:hypothetical protein
LESNLSRDNKLSDLQKISEEKDELLDSKLREAVHFDKEENKSKLNNEKDLKHQMQSHLKLITQLKNELKRKDHEVKDIHRQMKDRVCDLEKENQQLKKQKHVSKFDKSHPSNTSRYNNSGS